MDLSEYVMLATAAQPLAREDPRENMDILTVPVAASQTPANLSPIDYEAAILPCQSSHA